MTKTKIQQVTERLVDALPNDIKCIEKDIQTKFAAVLQITLAELNLVTQEEFRVQQQVLLRTREKLGQLEERVTHLEEKAKTSNRTS